jgi:release factor glutamine methyltransferase
MREKEEMASHVVGKEPDRALFVPNEDPLMFYRAIAQKLDRVAFEIHHLYGAELMEMLDGLGFKKRILRQDLQGRDRMIFAERI